MSGHVFCRPINGALLTILFNDERQKKKNCSQPIDLNYMSLLLIYVHFFLFCCNMLLTLRSFLG